MSSGSSADAVSRASDRIPPLNRLAPIAEEQWGLVTTRQAEQADVPWSTLARLIASGRLERVANGVYRIRGGAPPDHLDLRAAWLQLDPGQPAWQRVDDPNVALISHSSATALYGVGDLPTDVHEFIVPMRRQTRREDVRLHRSRVEERDRLILHGLPVTRAGRMIGDLLGAHVEPATVAQITREVLERVYDYPQVVAGHIAPYAARYNLPPHDGRAMLDYLLHLADLDNTSVWLEMVPADASRR